MLWLSTSGRASTTMRIASWLPWKSGMSTSTRQPGAWRRISVNDLSKCPRAADQIVVAIDAGDHGMLQAQRGHGLGDAARLVKIDRLGAALGHGAESAAARAQVAQHHEGRGLVVPALADVGAVGALATVCRPSERARRLSSW